MVADALTKLCTADSIKVLIEAMEGRLPACAVAHRPSVSAGPGSFVRQSGGCRAKLLWIVLLASVRVLLVLVFLLGSLFVVHMPPVISTRARSL